MAGEKELLRPLGMAGVEPIPANGIEELAAQLEHDLKIDHVNRERLAHLVQGTLGLVLECQPDPHQLHRRGRLPKIALSLIIFWLREVFEDLGQVVHALARRVPDAYGAIAWIDNYCQAHPLEEVAETTEQLIFEMRAK